MTIRSARDVVAQARAGVTILAAEDAVAEVGAPGTVFVDVREAAELTRSGTVAGAVHVPRGLLEFQADPASPTHEARLDPAKRIVLFCASGARSALAARTLQDMGYADVASVEGGFSALEKAGAATATT